MVSLVLAIGAVAAPAVVWAGTPGSDPANGSWVGGKVLNPGPEPLVLWTLPGSGGHLGTCIDAEANGPLHGPYALSSTVPDAEYGELNHLFADPHTSDVRLAELSALNSHKYDTVDKALQWSYLVNGQGGTSVADADAMLAQAKALAGPYSVTVAWPSTDTAENTPYSATITVSSAAGKPVPNENVVLIATGAALTHSTVTTDASGRAVVGFRIATGTSSTFTVSAAVQSWTAVSIYAAKGEQRMMSAAAPTTQHGSSSGSIVRVRDVNIIKVRADDPTRTPVPGYTYSIADATGHVVVPSITTAAAAAGADLGPLPVGATYIATELSTPKQAALYIPANRSFRFTVPAGPGVWTIVAPDPKVPSPTVATHASTQRAIVGQTLSDTVTVAGDDGEDATIAARLYGPVSAPASGVCTDLELAAYLAAPQRTFSAAVHGSPASGNGDVVVSGPVVTQPGCYGWAETLTLTPSGATAASPPTAPAESTLVTAPAVRTTVSRQLAVAGMPLSDQVEVTGLNGQSAMLTATLYGPLPPDSTHGCAQLGTTDWRTAIASGGSALVVGSDTMPVAGDGRYRTPEHPITAPGCYTYSERLTPVSTPALTITTPYAVPSESTLLTVPTLTTAVSATLAVIDARVTDAVTVRGTVTMPGTVTARLVGPLPPRAGSCAGLSWAQAPVAAVIKELSIPGDGTYHTAPTTLRQPGCYTFVEQLTLVGQSMPILTTPAGAPTETVLVRAPAAPTSAMGAPPTSAAAPSSPLAVTGPRAPLTISLLVGSALLGAGSLLLFLTRRRARV